MCLAVPGKILRINGEDPAFKTGQVSFGGIVKEINLAYTPEAGINDYVIVHAGFAISKIDEKEAQQIFNYLKQINELDDLKHGEPNDS